MILTVSNYILICLICLSLVITDIKAQDNDSKFEFTPQMRKSSRRLQSYCQKKIDISNETLEKIRADIIENDSKVKCFFHCLFDIVGMMDSTNHVNIDNLLALLPPSWHDAIVKVHESCNHISIPDACEASYQLTLCYIGQKTGLRLLV